MNVLDIDLDAFVRPRPDRKAVGGRLDATRFQPWPADEIECFITSKCSLRADRPVPGKSVVYHHELFDIWKRLIDANKLRTPFHVVHVDSHADLGMGDGSPEYVMCELLHCPTEARCNPKRGGHGGLLEGNYLLFALACGWISSIDYVHHPQLWEQNGGTHDIPDCLFRNNDRNVGTLQLKRLLAKELPPTRRLKGMTTVSLEAEVPIQLISVEQFFSNRNFDFVFVAHSPNYTPGTSDPAFEAMSKFLAPIC